MLPLQAGPQAPWGLYGPFCLPLAFTLRKALILGLLFKGS